MATQHHSQPAAACSVCDGTGWKQVAIPGKASRMTRCDCRISARNQQLLEKAGIPARYKNCTLANFNLEMHEISLSVRNAHRDAQRFVQEYPLEKQGMLLIGSIGVGKTHLAVGMIQALMQDKGVPCRFCDYRELLKEIQASYNPASESTEMKILEPIRTVEILILDDLGASKPSDWVRDIVGIVLNARYNDKRTTIITTNYLDNPAPEGEVARLPGGKLILPTREDSLEQRIGTRMRSRLYEMCRTVEVCAPDFRREKTQAGRAQA